MMKIVILGTPVAPGNRGVMALGASAVTLFEAVCGENRQVDATFLLVHEPWGHVTIQGYWGPRTVNVVTCRMSLAAKLRDHLFWILFLALLYRLIPFLRDWIVTRSPWLKVVVEADVVGDIRGGDSFSDIYGLKRFLLAALPVLAVLLVRRRIVHLPQTYGPYRSSISRALAGWLIRRSSLAVARDTDSQALAQGFMGQMQKVRLSPDVAFMLRAQVPTVIECSPSWVESERSTLIGLNVNGLMYNGGYDRKDMFSLSLNYPEYLRSLVVRLLDLFPGEIILIPHTYARDGDVESDNEACKKLFASLSEVYRKRVRIVTGDYDQHNIKGVIGKCGFFIGSRMHACIAALSQGIPCVGVAYSKKFIGVFRSVGVDDWVIDGRSVTTELAVAKTIELMGRRDQAATVLSSKVAEAEALLRQVFVEIVAAEKGD